MDSSSHSPTPGLSDYEIEVEYRRGLSGAKIAKRARLSRATIYRRLIARGVPMRRVGARDLQLDRDKVISMYKVVLNPSAIARHFGCHRVTIARLLRAEGLLL